MTMDKPIQILFVGNDPALPSEVQSALAGVPNCRTVPHFAADVYEALDVAVNRHPQLICLQMGSDTRELTSFAREMRASLPDTVVVAMYSPLGFNPEQSESATLIEVLRANVQDFLRRPLSSTELRQLLDRLFQPRAAAARKTSGKVLSFVSNKGGVGKSTLSVNTACDLAVRHPGQVLLIDASLQLGICALMLDSMPQTTLTDAARERERLDGTLLRRLTVQHPCGLHLLAAPKDAVEAAEVTDASFARVLNVARRVFDYIVVDTFPILDSLMLSLLDVSDLVYVVMQGTVPNVVGTVRLLSVLDALGLPIERQRLVLNQNYSRFAGNLRPQDIQQRLGRQLDYAFPYQKRVLVAMNTGRPYILKSMRFYGFGHEMSALVDEIEAVRQEQPEETGGAAQQSPLVQKATS
jgi:pilus assembly protein CpaE